MQTLNGRIDANISGTIDDLVIDQLMQTLNGRIDESMDASNE